MFLTANEKAQVAERIVNRLLESLADSTLWDEYPGAYDMLVDYRMDMESDIFDVLENF